MEKKTWNSSEEGKNEYEAKENCEVQLVSGSAYKNSGHPIEKGVWTKLEQGGKVGDIGFFEIKIRPVPKDSK
jgi:hypothetical protein